MPVKFVAGDVLSAEGLEALAVATACDGSWDCALADGVKRRWPAMFAEYEQLCESGKFGVGDVFAWRDDEVVVFSLGARPRASAPTTAAALDDALRRMLRLATEMGITTVGLPRIAAGLPWTEARAVLEAIGTPASVELVVYEGATQTEAPE